MLRFTVRLAMMGAALLVGNVPPVASSRAIAFELDSPETAPASSPHFGDPDEAPLPAPLPSAKLEEESTSGQIAPPATGLQLVPGAGLQLAPGTSLQIAPGTSLQMSTTGDRGSDNPADNRALIPSP